MCVVVWSGAGGCGGYKAGIEGRVDGSGARAQEVSRVQQLQRLIPAHHLRHTKKHPACPLPRPPALPQRKLPRSQTSPPCPPSAPSPPSTCSASTPPTSTRSPRTTTSASTKTTSRGGRRTSARWRTQAVGSWGTVFPPPPPRTHPPPSPPVPALTTRRIQ